MQKSIKKLIFKKKKNLAIMILLFLTKTCFFLKLIPSKLNSQLKKKNRDNGEYK